MGTLGFLLVLAIQGLIVGAFARLALPGRDPLTLVQTIGVGLAGTLVAGVIVYAATDGRAAPSFVVSLIFAVAIMYLIRRRRGGGLTHPGAGDGR